MSKFAIALASALMVATPVAAMAGQAGMRPNATNQLMGGKFDGTMSTCTQRNTWGHVNGSTQPVGNGALCKTYEGAHGKMPSNVGKYGQASDAGIAVY